jgi:hypothetical protein
MSFYKEIENIFDYIVSIRKVDEYVSFDTLFPSKWSVLKTQVDESKTVFTKNDENGKYVSFISNKWDDDISKTIETIESIITYNKEREEKEKLFTQKVKELKILFEKESLDGLRNLKIDKDETTRFEEHKEEQSH